MDNLSMTFDEKKREWIDQDGTRYSEDLQTLKRFSKKYKGGFRIPNSVTSTGNSAFGGCLNLTAITLPKAVTSIGNSAFERCSSLREITIPKSVTRIGEKAFSGCTSLREITIPKSVTRIEEKAFSGCSTLSKIKIPASLTSIGESAFKDCVCLSNIIIPSSVTCIRKQAFSGCSSLNKIIIPKSVTSIGIRVFKNCSSLKKVTIPESAKSIGEWAFWECSSLREVIIPKYVTSIGDRAFGGCSRLKGITIPKSVTRIGRMAFYGCYNLRKIEIPQSVKEIGEKAFWGCSIKSVDLPPKTEYHPNSFDEVTRVVKAKVAISYSWDSERHKAWVRKLAKDLQEKGIYVILDQWELKPGQLIPHFMATSIKEAERVICIMTPNYKKKTDKLEGGVGYEYSIIDSEISKNNTGNKIIPILREGSEDDFCPSSLSGRMYLDFREDDSYENSLNLLIREIFKVEDI